MGGVLVEGDVVAVYEDFAAYAGAADDSPCFTEWALGVVGDAEVRAWLETLPAPKRQPNLVFAAARWHGLQAPAPYDALRAALLGDDGSVRATILARATQTNEAGRMATLLPALAAVAALDDEPLALVEVGASAGLCLYPDRWGHRYRAADGEVVHEVGVGEDRPVLECRVDGAGAARAPLPDRLPRVAWRGGVDLHPLDVTDHDATDWLETLVWPEHEDRRRVLAAAVEVARQDPPHLVPGDLVEELPALVERAAAHGRVVVQHSAVLSYLPEPARRRAEELLRGLVAERACHWLSNEGPDVLPGVTATGPAPPPGLFVLGLDGRAVAWTHAHGRTLTWTAPDSDLP